MVPIAAVTLFFVCVCTLPARANPVVSGDRDYSRTNNNPLLERGDSFQGFADFGVAHMSQASPVSSSHEQVVEEAKLKLATLLKSDKLASFWDYILEKLRSLASVFPCDFCKAATFLVQQLLALQKPQDEIALALASLCKTLNIQDDRVCDSVVQVFKVSLKFFQLKKNKF